MARSISFPYTIVDTLSWLQKTAQIIVNTDREEIVLDVA